ncbi:hypothetical protein [Ectobacillus funiculus]|uniref:Uncharacterized protein n=1 Tax=Ectobacillus funiculus TaxID=137993 RepID=A0ABV5WG08_9BACI
MTKETAVYLLRSKDVYLTIAGRRMLQKIVSKGNKNKKKRGA